jgi:putative transposase
VTPARLHRTDEGQVRLQLRQPWRDGTTDVVFDPVEFLERLAVLVPRPRINLILYNDKQSEVFLNALKWAGISVRTAPVPGAVDLYMTEPVDDPESAVHALASKILRFLQGALAAADQ